MDKAERLQLDVAGNGRSSSRFSSSVELRRTASQYRDLKGGDEVAKEVGLLLVGVVAVGEVNVKVTLAVCVFTIGLG